MPSASKWVGWQVFRDRVENEVILQWRPYRTIIKQLLTQYATSKLSHGDIETQTIFDTENDHYQMVSVGWDNKHCIYGYSIHIDIKNEKIWLQTNNTELDIGQDLITMGVPKEDIVIGFQPPYMRSFSSYAIT